MNNKIENTCNKLRNANVEVTFLNDTADLIESLYRLYINAIEENVKLINEIKSLGTNPLDGYTEEQYKKDADRFFENKLFYMQKLNNGTVFKDVIEWFDKVYFIRQWAKENGKIEYTKKSFPDFKIFYDEFMKYYGEK